MGAILCSASAAVTRIAAAEADPHELLGAAFHPPAEHLGHPVNRKHPDRDSILSQKRAVPQSKRSRRRRRELPRKSSKPALSHTHQRAFHGTDPRSKQQNGYVSAMPGIEKRELECPISQN